MIAMVIPKKQIRIFQNMIFAWWESNRRDLPWRHTRDPYKILVSEIMLQQTQVCRVLPKYKEFIRVFPDVYSLAHAKPAKVLTLWQGMGYNRRALYLKKTAEAVVKNYHGNFPDREELLTKLPGLGTYTARALLVFAFDQNVAVVDTNIRQIITHFFFHGLPQKEKIIQEVAEVLLPRGTSWAWHQALMDYGAIALEHKSNQRSRKTIPSFKDSKRFYRGRVVDRLRVGSILERELISEVMATYGKTEQYVLDIIETLIRDGLVVRSRRKVIGLPQ